MTRAYIYSGYFTSLFVHQEKDVSDGTQYLFIDVKYFFIKI